MFRKKGKERLSKTTKQNVASKSNNQFTTTEFEKDDVEDKDAEVKDFSIDLIYSNPFLVEVS
jgi:tRNA1(Val) A37 N6-methylase TrmN6